MIDKGVDNAHREFEAASAAAERRVAVTLTSMQPAEPSGARRGPGKVGLAGRTALMKGLTGGLAAASEPAAGKWAALHCWPRKHAMQKIVLDCWHWCALYVPAGLHCRDS